LRKQSKSWNIFYLLSSGALIVYVVSRYLKKKKETDQEPNQDQTQDQSPNIIPISNSNTLTETEIFNLIKKEEGLALKAYPDGKDANGRQLYSIGYGHQIKPNESNLLTGTITTAKANDLLKNDVGVLRAELKRLIKVPINKNQELAIISFRYNIGPGAFEKSTFLRKLNAKDYEGASNEFKRWKFTDNGTRVSPTLILRREREKKLFDTLPGGSNQNRPSKEDLQRKLKEAEDQMNKEIQKLKDMLKPEPPKYNA
jgi:lysozyme